MFKTTADNLQIIANAFVTRDGNTPEELDEIIAALRDRVIEPPEPLRLSKPFVAPSSGGYTAS